MTRWLENRWWAGASLSLEDRICKVCCRDCRDTGVQGNGLELEISVGGTCHFGHPFLFP